MCQYNTDDVNQEMMLIKKCLSKNMYIIFKWQKKKKKKYPTFKETLFLTWKNCQMKKIHLLLLNKVVSTFDQLLVLTFIPLNTISIDYLQPWRHLTIFVHFSHNDAPTSIHVCDPVTQSHTNVSDWTKSFELNEPSLTMGWHLKWLHAAS